MYTKSWDIWRYKLRVVGLRNSLRLAYLDLSEEVQYRVAWLMPSISFSPRSIQLECTTRCNLKCTMCEISYWSEPGGDLQLEHLRKMLDHLPKLKRVDLTGIGEALMNRTFFDALKLLKSRGLYITLNDNFTLMTEGAARALIDLGVEQIFLSLDGATKRTYEAIRVGANFDKVIANAKRLIELKHEMGKKLPEVKVNTVVSADNYHEIPEIIPLAHNIGVGMVQFVNVMTFQETTNLCRPELRRQVDDKLREARVRAERLGIRVKTELFDKLPVQQCGFPWKRNFVTYDGAVHPCCFTTQTGDRAAQNRRAFGNLRRDSFAEIWRGARYASLRRQLKQGVLPHVCAHCPKYIGRALAEPAKLAARRPNEAAGL